MSPKNTQNGSVDSQVRDALGGDLAGAGHGRDEIAHQRLSEFVNLKFAARGHDVVGSPEDYPFFEMGRALIANFQERLRLLSDYLCPADQHIQSFLEAYLADVPGVFAEGEAMVPTGPMQLERHGIARLLSLPAHSDRYQSSLVSSYRVHQGVCHNPLKDRRTTKGVFHVAEGGFPIPADKKSVPKATFAHLLKAALSPPDELMILPYTAEEEKPAKSFVSLLLRPLVSPEVPGVSPRRNLEVRFFAPGSLVCNLDFVESIFGNAGDPFLPDNDARLDVEHWSGHTGCVILAPHLIHLRKKDVGLPHVSEATERQKRDGMCWEKEDELYNEGGAFKVAARNERGVMVTLIADNYFGYCKKEVKTQISFAANLLGLAEEEHAGGALVFPCADLGESFELSQHRATVDHSFEEASGLFGDLMEIQPEGYGIDKRYPDVFYLPEDVRMSLEEQTISWLRGGEVRHLRLLPDRTYVLPSGYKIEMVKPTEGQRWRLVGTQAEGTFCHKPCTVSGGGKSEISKSIADAMVAGPVIMPEFENDMLLVDQLLRRDYGDRYKKPKRGGAASRPILDPERSLGSVIRLFSHSEEFTDEYNAFIATVPRTVRSFIFTLKRYYKTDWGDNWRGRFRVDSINGQPGVELKYRQNLVITRYLRVGFAQDGSWRMFGVRTDFQPAAKLQREDDITATITLPAEQVDNLHPDLQFPSYKFAENCEYRLFQRPDDAIIRGYDKTTEANFSRKTNFFSNYEPLTRPQAEEMLEDAIRFEQFTEPMRRTVSEFAAADSPDFFVSTAHPRLVDGKPSKNPRYLQNRLDLEDPRGEYLAEVGSRLFRRVPLDRPLHNPVAAVLPGRRNNPADRAAGIRPLAVFGPIHYQDLPELFMDYVASLTGKSPSTTGAGSEGALTKGPFNALPPVVDLNNALISYIVAGYSAFSSAAGYIGHRYRVDHDISLVVPEIWSRMYLHEREPSYLIENGYLEPVENFEHEGRPILGSRLGYRITEAFVQTFFGRVFTEPGTVFTDEMLRPELQGMEDYVDGIENICETQQRVARQYFEDRSVDMACPPLRALLHIMAEGSYEGKGIHDPEVRGLFDREAVMASDWYRERLTTRVESEKALLRRHVGSLQAFLEKPFYQGEAERLQIAERLSRVEAELERLENEGERAAEALMGTIGTDPNLPRAND